MITIRKGYRAVTAIMPKWLAVIVGIMLVIPGPEELIVILPLLILLPFRYKRAVSAYRGGKSHRVADAV